jgi:hypothetical protein
MINIPYRFNEYIFKTTLCATVYIVFLTSGLAQNFIWARQYGGDAKDEGKSITSDIYGNIYSTGSFIGTFDFDQRPFSSYFLTSSGQADIFVLKTDASGNFLWAKNMGGGLEDVGKSITVDSFGNVYTTGYFSAVADFNPGNGIYNLTTEGNKLPFISKLDKNGNFVWAKSFSSPNPNPTAVGNSIVSDAAGNTYTAGFTIGGGAIDFDPGSNMAFGSTYGASDIFITKFDSDGNFVWVNRIGGKNDDECKSITLDKSGNLYATGYFEGTVDFDASSSRIKNLTSGGSKNVFISKYSITGDLIWAKNTVGSDASIGTSLAVDDSNNVYTTGHFNGTTDFDPSTAIFDLIAKGEEDIFITKYNTSGDFVWAKNISGKKTEAGFSIALDIQNNIYLTGFFTDTVDFDPGPRKFELTSYVQDLFILNLDNAGEFKWAIGTRGVGYCQGLSLATDGTGNIYTIGTFNDAKIFETGLQLTPVKNSTDFFITRLSMYKNDIIQVTNNTTTSIFPNPTKDIVQINSDEILSGRKFTIYDIKCNLILGGKLDSDNTIYGLNYLSSGTYYLFIENHKNSFTLNIIE